MNLEKLLSKYGIKPDASKDQHFMSDKGMIKKIVSIADLKSEDVVLEVGAGVGSVTKFLASTKAKVIAVELDEALANVIQKELKGMKNLDVIAGNALDVISGIEFNKLVSNTPYAICEPLVDRLAKKRFDIAVMSVPESFSDIITAVKGDDRYSKLSMKVQGVFDISVEFTRKKKKVKNALMEGLINLNERIYGKAFTKNQARDVIRKSGLSKGLLEKNTGNLELRELEMVKGIKILL